jgi:sugar transferase (PEP-CTERM/EpsH1 system associated)
MRVLYLCHRVPYPLNKGEKIRAFHQLRAISAAHEVDLFTLADSRDDLMHEAALARHCRRVTIIPIVPSLARLLSLRALGSGKPLTLPYFYSSDLDRQVRAALLSRSYDRIFVFCSSMAQYVEWVDQIPILLDLVDVDSDKWRQYAAVARFPFSAIYRREANCLRQYERKVCERFSRVLVTTEREAQLLRQISNVARVHVIPIGVDIDYFDPAQIPPEAAAPAIIFTGDMGYLPNEEAVLFFARKVLPMVHRSFPEVRFLIVGRNPSRKVRQLQKIEGVEVTGFIPDVRPYLAKAKIAVAPLFIACGIQNKILEAMAYGLPVVATGRAVQGLSTGVAELVETGDSAEELAAKTMRLLSDPQLARRKGIEGRRRVAAEYNWDKNLDRLLQLLENPVSGDIHTDMSRAEVTRP